MLNSLRKLWLLLRMPLKSAYRDVVASIVEGLFLVGSIGRFNFLPELSLARMPELYMCQKSCLGISLLESCVNSLNFMQF